MHLATLDMHMCMCTCTRACPCTCPCACLSSHRSLAGFGASAGARAAPMYGPGWPLTPPDANQTPSSTDGLTQKGSPGGVVLYLSPDPAPAPAGPSSSGEAGPSSAAAPAEASGEEDFDDAALQLVQGAVWASLNPARPHRPRDPYRPQPRHEGLALALGLKTAATAAACCWPGRGRAWATLDGVARPEAG